MTNTPSTQTHTENDRCRSCRSETLFSGFFDADDLAHTTDGPGIRWTTFCQECGTEWTPIRRRNRR